MPFVVRSDSKNEAELVFLSPEEEIKPPKNDPLDQGASPVLRQSNRNRKSITAYSDNGGVAVLWRKNVCNMRRLEFPNPDDFEVLPVAGGLRGNSRKMVVIGCYLPPSYNKRRGEEALVYINNLVVPVKRKFTDPFIVLAGDFNQWRIGEALADFPDLREAPVGPTRHDKHIDKIYTNFSRTITESGTIEPLETDDSSRQIDHRVAFCTAELTRLNAFTWQKYSYRHYNEESAEKFKEWLVLHEWQEVLTATGSNEKAEAYQKTITDALEKFFPLKTTQKKSTDLPWMNKRILKLIKDRKKIFMEAGGKRTPEWKEEKKRVAEVIKQRKRGYIDNQKEHLLSNDANRNFFKHVKNFSKFEKPREFDVREIVTGSDVEVSEKLADYFIEVSREFEPLEPGDILAERPEGGRILERYEVAARLKKMRKPKSMVPGDIYPQLVTLFSDLLAIPLTSVYNEILRTYIWPTCWKQEFVTVIPKKSSPQDLGDLRNISCTMLASKVFETFVLDCLKSEVKLRHNQYGGVRGLGTDSLLVQLWQETLQNLEDYRAGTIITSIDDYSKAFNRMSYQHCLAALHKKGASASTVKQVATFLTNRSMTVKVGQVLLNPRKIWGAAHKDRYWGSSRSTRRSVIWRNIVKT